MPSRVAYAAAVRALRILVLCFAVLAPVQVCGQPSTNGEQEAVEIFTSKVRGLVLDLCATYVQRVQQTRTPQEAHERIARATNKMLAETTQHAMRLSTFGIHHANLYDLNIGIVMAHAQLPESPNHNTIRHWISKSSEGTASHVVRGFKPHPEAGEGCQEYHPASFTGTRNLEMGQPCVEGGSIAISNIEWGEEKRHCMFFYTSAKRDALFLDLDRAALLHARVKDAPARILKVFPEEAQIPLDLDQTAARLAEDLGPHLGIAVAPSALGRPGLGWLPAVLNSLVFPTGHIVSDTKLLKLYRGSAPIGLLRLSVYIVLSN